MTVLALLLLGWAAAGASAQDLSVGDNAPPLKVKEFVKGDAVSEFAKGKIYVVEFWATWCGPCRATIPHVSELQKKHKDVTMIGVAVWERNPDSVKPFVKSMGEKMDYRVAMDDVPAGGEPGEGAMAKAWMKAAGQDGIPASFIVNGDGKIAWIGHPGSMDKPLEEIVTGKWDLATAARKYKAQQAAERKLAVLEEKIEKAKESGDPKEALTLIDAAIAENADLEESLGTEKFALLVGKGGDRAKAISYGQHLVEKVYKDSPNKLNNLAWSIVDPDVKSKPDAALLKFALQAAQRGDEAAQSKDPAIADTLAKAYFDNGDAAKALETQERAVKLAVGTQFERDPDLKTRLEQYRKAANK